MTSSSSAPVPSIGEILDRALDKERQAQAFYAGLVRQCEIEFVRELLEKLMDEEHKHVLMIQAIQTRLNLGQDPV